jgi:hypothetical protein
MTDRFPWSPAAVPTEIAKPTPKTPKPSDEGHEPAVSPARASFSSCPCLERETPELNHEFRTRRKENPVL